MRPRSCRKYILLCLLWISGCASLEPMKSGNRVNGVAFQDSSYVVLISIDGYRYDYTEKYHPPTLDRFRKTGASAKSLIPVFPSKTFTNHYSIATGLYSENHGIVANRFFD